MIRKNAVRSKVLAILILSTVTSGQLLGSQSAPHLLPAGPNFDRLPPYGKKYAEICERLLFPVSDWLIRYFEVTGDEPAYDTGITIYQKKDGSYWLMVRQASPDIGDLVANAAYGSINLEASLASIKIEASNRQIPSNVALEIYELWLALLQKTRAPDKRDETVYIHPITVILFAKDRHGTTLSGKCPLDAAKHRMFTSLEAIVNKLLESCDAPDKKRDRLFRDVLRRARNLRESLK